MSNLLKNMLIYYKAIKPMSNSPITASRHRLNQKLQQYQSVQTALQRENATLIQIKAKKEISQQANTILQAVFAQIQENVHKTISDIVTRCLKAVFKDNAYEFKIAFEQKRNKIEAEIQFIKNNEIYNPLTQSGGGVLDVASFGLRLSAVLLSQIKRNRRILILDEPFRFLSVEYRPAIRDLIQQLSEELDFQFVTVTHAKELEIGEIIRIE
jgi:ABC-type glutathione transport system ATPase component